MEAYVDDVVVKTKEFDSFIPDLEETFNSLRSFRWKLNPTKCVFGVPSGKLLGFIVSHRGIEANPENINAIMNVEAYVDNVVVKTKEFVSFIPDLEESFNSLRSFMFKLNPTKCVFGVPSEKLLGFIVSHRGIEANPEKINAIINMEAPASIKECSEAHWMHGCPKQISIETWRKRTPFLQDTQKTR